MLTRNSRETGVAPRRCRPRSVLAGLPGAVRVLDPTTRSDHKGEFRYILVLLQSERGDYMTTSRTSAEDRSLFLRLLPSMGSRDSEQRIDGHETYLTQAVGLVLQHDPTLVRRLLSSWLGIEVQAAAEVRVATEISYPVPGEDKEGIIDLVIEAPGHLVFIENKVGASLNRYLTASGSETVDQVEWYARVLRGQSQEGLQGHVLLLSRSPHTNEGRPDEYRGQKFWWDLYKVLQVHHDTPADGHARWLQLQFLHFFDEVHLDPPLPLSRETFVQRHAVRLLAEAGRLAGDLANVRITGDRFLTFDAPVFHGQFNPFRPDDPTSQDRQHQVWFDDQGGLCALRSSIGRLQLASLDEEFWNGGLETQVATLAGILQRLHTFAAVRGARLTLEEISVRFGDHAGLVIDLSMTIQRAWGVQAVPGKNTAGVAEVSHRVSKGHTIRLKPTRDGGELILATPEDGASTLRVEVAQLVVGLPKQKNRFQVNVPLRLVQSEHIVPLLEVMARRVPPANALAAVAGQVR